MRALVIDGVLDPRLWSSGWQIKSDRVATQEEFDEFLRLCDEAGPDCAFSAPEGSAARWEALAAALARASRSCCRTASLYSYDFLIGDATSAMYAPEVWGGPEGAGALLDRSPTPCSATRPRPTAVAPTARTRSCARLTPPAAGGRLRQRPRRLLRQPVRRRPVPVDVRRLPRRSASTPRPARGSARCWWWFNAGCANWPVNRDRYVGPWSTRTSAPVLVVGNFFDGVTDYAGAEASARLLRNSRLLTYAGWGHTAYGRSACVTDYVDAYLLDGSLPARGTVCPANPNPFLPSAARTAAEPAPLLGLPTLLPTRD